MDTQSGNCLMSMTRSVQPCLFLQHPRDVKTALAIGKSMGISVRISGTAERGVKGLEFGLSICLERTVRVLRISHENAPCPIARIRRVQLSVATLL